MRVSRTGWRQAPKRHCNGCGNQRCRRVQAIRIDRLGQVIVHAGRQAALAILGEGIGGHGDDRGRGVAGQLADAPGDFQAIDARHQQIHQDQVVAGCLHLAQGLFAVPGDSMGRPTRSLINSAATSQLSGSSSTSRMRADLATPPAAPAVGRSSPRNRLIRR
jgi:hypothetical protein